MVQDSIHYPSLPSADYKYFGTANDYYEFFPDDSVHEQFGTPGLPRYFNFTAAYFLSNNSTISLKLDPHGYYTIVMLTENALVLSNQVYASYVRGNTYYGIRITNFKR